MKVVAIGQTRLGSTRLPAKVMLALGGMTVLEMFVRRLQRTSMLDEVVIATSTEARDEVIVAECHRLGVECFRGDEADVLSRYYHCARAYQADIVIRVTSDCPLLDPELLAAGIASHQETGADFSSNNLTRTFPHGVDFQIISFAALEQSYRQALAADEREHVVEYIERHPADFKINSIESPEQLAHVSFVLDTLDDYQKLCRLIAALDDPLTAGYLEVVAHC